MGGVFRHYEIVKRIGVGGMAEVFLANAVGFDGSTRRVVIKQILPHYSQDLGFQKMLLDEAMITASLHHPNVVQALDFGRLDERLFIALEYVDGLDLARL